MKTSTPPPRAKRIDAARRTQLLATFERSGLSAAAFARQHDISYTTFCGWRQRHAKSKPSPAFMQVELTAAPAPAGLIIEVGRIAQMRIESASQIGLAAQLLQTLNSAGPC